MLAILLASNVIVVVALSSQKRTDGPIQVGSETLVFPLLRKL